MKQPGKPAFAVAKLARQAFHPQWLLIIILQKNQHVAHQARLVVTGLIHQPHPGNQQPQQRVGKPLHRFRAVFLPALGDHGKQGGNFLIVSRVVYHLAEIFLIQRLLQGGYAV